MIYKFLIENSIFVYGFFIINGDGKKLSSEFVNELKIIFAKSNNCA